MHSFSSGPHQEQRGQPTDSFSYQLIYTSIIHYIPAKQHRSQLLQPSVSQSANIRFIKRDSRQNMANITSKDRGSPSSELETSKHSTNDTTCSKYRRRRKALHKDPRGMGSLSTLQRFSLVALCVISSQWAARAFHVVPNIPIRSRIAVNENLFGTPFHFKKTSLLQRQELLLIQRQPSSTTLLGSTGGDAEETTDENEWRAMLLAFQMYKAAYGNLKVPLRFVVPSLAPWPG